PSRSTLFPYTTLFRSRCLFTPAPVPCSCRPPGAGRGRDSGQTRSVTLLLPARVHRRAAGRAYSCQEDTSMTDESKSQHARKQKRSEEHTSELQSRFDL